MSTILQQYKAIKAKYPDAILLFRVGDCYETFDADAQVVAQHLKLPFALSSIDELKETTQFPFHALDSHLRTLVKGGYRVAICEELEDPTRAKGISKRGVTDLI